MSENQRTHRWKQRASALEVAEVIAWDGEGIGHLEHKYVLLAHAISRRSGDLSYGPELRSRDGLRTEDMLDMVWRTGVAHPKAYNVMYGATYDWNNWVGEFNYDSAKFLHEGHKVWIGPYGVQYNGLWFDVTRAGHTVTVWDVWRFWGQGFAASLTDALPDFHGLPVIRRFKELRGGFTWDMIDAVAHYNRLELDGLILLVRQLFRDLNQAGIQRPSYLTGSGAIAGSLLRQHGMRDHNEQPPPEVPVNAGFSAGRIEDWKIGVHDGPFFVHDIRSAYPDAMRHLPSMAGGSWRRASEFEPGWASRMGLWHVRWDYTRRDGPKPPTRRCYPFFYRQPNGVVLYPAAGQGWQWWPEVLMARELGWEFEVNDGWVFDPAEPESYPFDWVPPLYEKRKTLKHDGLAGAARELKYGLNSLYGKMCQARGATADDPPAFHNLAWAGWVTSFTRAKLLEAAMQDPESVVYCMTDSIAATRRFELDEGEGLGQWEVTEYDRALVIQAGVGSLWKDGKRSDKYRGFDRDTIKAGTVIEAWKRDFKERRRVKVEVPSERPVTLGSALVNWEWFDKWNTWQPTPRTLDCYGGDGKRVWTHTPGGERPWLRLSDLEPFGYAGFEEVDLLDSAPYRPKWEDVDPLFKEEVDGILVDIIERELEAGALA